MFGLQHASDGTHLAIGRDTTPRLPRPDDLMSTPSRIKSPSFVNTTFSMDFAIAQSSANGCAVFVGRLRLAPALETEEDYKRVFRVLSAKTEGLPDQDS